eukprot:175895-Prorocentrum_minimum.AAC.1
MITGPPPPPGPELENNVVFQTRGKPDSGASRSEPQAHSSGVEGIQVVVIGENSEEAGAGSAEGSLAGVSGPGARVYTNPVSVLALEGGDAELASAAVPGFRCTRRETRRETERRASRGTARARRNRREPARAFPTAWTCRETRRIARQPLACARCCRLERARVLRLESKFYRPRRNRDAPFPFPSRPTGMGSLALYRIRFPPERPKGGASLKVRRLSWLGVYKAAEARPGVESVLSQAGRPPRKGPRTGGPWPWRCTARSATSASAPRARECAFACRGSPGGAKRWGRRTATRRATRAGSASAARASAPTSRRASPMPLLRGRCWAGRCAPRKSFQSFRNDSDAVVVPPFETPRLPPQQLSDSHFQFVEWISPPKAGFHRQKQDFSPPEAGFHRRK